ncbi:hypothetical protein ACFSUM_18360 [Virgibacillus siamensis]|uniref:hypothetical protein n=1 Tax=Virgibacillus siamensis TaxID=480071 RepID=UPI00363851B3
MTSGRIKIFGAPAAQDRADAPNSFFYYYDEICFIDTVKPKGNYQVPCIYVGDYTFGPSLTLANCQAGFPHFQPFINGGLLNLKLVDRFEQTSVGFRGIFKGTENIVEMSNYKWNEEDWNGLLEKAKDQKDDDRLIAGVRIETEGKKSREGETKLFSCNDIEMITTCTPKANYKVPMYVTKHGNFIEALTLQAYKLLFPDLFPLLNSNLVNMDRVDRAVDKRFDIEVYFKGATVKTSMANKYKKHLKHLFT